MKLTRFCMVAFLLSAMPNVGFAYMQTIDSGTNIGVSVSGAVDFTFTGATTPVGDGLLTVEAHGDLENPAPFADVESVSVFAETSSGSGGTLLGTLFTGDPPADFLVDPPTNLFEDDIATPFITPKNL